MATALRASLLVGLSLTACEDVRDFTRRIARGAEDLVADSVAEREAEALCDIAKGGATDYSSLMAQWEQSPYYGDNLKRALESVARSQRYDVLAHAAGDGWSCPELEPVIESGG